LSSQLTMKYPPYLKEGDKVAIVSPAGKIDRTIVERGAEILIDQGYIVEIGKHAFDHDGVFAGSDEARVADMQKAIEDKTVKAIFCSRGGYGSLRIQQRLNWSAFFKKPKWLIGFSDITVFHAYLTKHQIASIHGVMPAFFEREGALTESFIKTLNALRGDLPQYTIEPQQFNRLGKTVGILTGGNLSILQSLRGTPLDISPKGKILFIEDTSEYHYHLDRMMTNLKAGRVLEQISGLIVGSFTEMKDGETPYGKSAYEIIREAVAAYRYPVVFNFPAGHQLPNFPLILGGRVSLNVTPNEVTISPIVNK
jgi:muramoyltetrapeptide carboxypeptidase